MTRFVPAAPPTGEKEIDGKRILQTLAQRWQAAQTLDYRSRAVMSHAGEFLVHLNISAQLRRARFARLVFDADRPDVSRLRVCDGRALFERTRGSFLRPAQTTREGLSPGGKVTQNIPHPLDEASYCVDQFFSPTPFFPPKTWGDGTGRIQISAEQAATKSGQAIFRIILAPGTSRDTLTLDAQNYAPIEMVRVGEHAGKVQELLRETFTTVRLGPYLPAQLFAWTTARDEAANTTYLDGGTATQ